MVGERTRRCSRGCGFTPPNPYTGGVTYRRLPAVHSGTSRSIPQYAVSDTTNSTATPTTTALQLSLRQRPAHGVDFMLNYTYSKSIDDVGTFRTTDNPRLDRSLSVTRPAAEHDGNGGVHVAVRQGEHGVGERRGAVAGRGTGAFPASSPITPACRWPSPVRDARALRLAPACRAWFLASTTHGFLQQTAGRRDGRNRLPPTTTAPFITWT